MTFLLDTHSFLYFVMGSQALSGRARTLIEDTDNTRLLSLASVWEIAIKTSIGKLAISLPLEELISSHVTANAITLLPIGLRHIALVSTLPFHHRDPFDRLLVAQSLAEDLPLVSADTRLDRYGIERLW
jgi:PIN domain nuclease of toxin-antitoxin system